MNERLARAAVFGLLAFAAMLYSASDARAQWVTTKDGTYITTNVGIGTTVPAAILDSQRLDTNDLLMRLWNTSTTTGTATLRIANSSNAGGRLQFTDSNSYVSTIFADRTGGLRFRTGNAASEAALVDRMTILPAGNVGIGRVPDAPYKLDVAGDMRVNGNIAAKYQDVAEWVPSTQKLTAGMVVVVDNAGVNHVLASTAAYDTSVAGVISAQPGIALGEAGEGKVLVATTGRVKVRVDATRLPIRAGDLLVTSEREGYAMKSEPVAVGSRKMHSPGTIIGKALESLDKGTGEILVLLSLQ